QMVDAQLFWRWTVPAIEGSAQLLLKALFCGETRCAFGALG
ncbi:MAG: hypothetical protein AVDCRST_MAG93-777, partial [uncultured Chloroflexia bacterium]